jgi:hypothetical protein
MPQSVGGDGFGAILRTHAMTAAGGWDYRDTLPYHETQLAMPTVRECIWGLSKLSP